MSLDHMILVTGESIISVDLDTTLQYNDSFNLYFSVYFFWSVNNRYAQHYVVTRFDTMSINTIALIFLPDVDLHTQTYKYFHQMYIFTCYM